MRRATHSLSYIRREIKSPPNTFAVRAFYSKMSLLLWSIYQRFRSRIISPILVLEDDIDFYRSYIGILFGQRRSPFISLPVLLVLQFIDALFF